MLSVWLQILWVPVAMMIGYAVILQYMQSGLEGSERYSG